jgi:hemerythrin
MLNELVSFCEDGSETEKLQRTLDNLVDYTVRHFHDEESLQIEYNYPEYQNHKKMHDDFKSEVGRLLDAFQKSGSSAALSKDVNRIMVRWIIFHVQNEDRKIGAYIKKVNSRR